MNLDFEISRVDCNDNSKFQSPKEVITVFSTANNRQTFIHSCKFFKIKLVTHEIQFPDTVLYLHKTKQQN